MSELTVYDSVKPDITQPAAAVVQLGSNGEGRAGACLGKSCLGEPACLGGMITAYNYPVPHFLNPHAQIYSSRSEAPWASDITAVTAYLTRLPA